MESLVEIKIKEDGKNGSSITVNEFVVKFSAVAKIKESLKKGQFIELKVVG